MGVSFPGFLAPLKTIMTAKRHPKNGLNGIANISSHLINWCLVSSWPTVCMCVCLSISLSVRYVSFDALVRSVYNFTWPDSLSQVLSLSSQKLISSSFFLSFLNSSLLLLLLLLFFILIRLLLVNLLGSRPFSH